MKKLLAVLFAVLLLSSCGGNKGKNGEDTSVTTEAQTTSETKNELVKTYERGDYVYEVKADGSARIFAYNGEETDVVTPAVFEDREGVKHTVTEIYREAYAECVSIKTLKISEGVEIIGEGGFTQCRELERVTFPDSLKVIEIGAFFECLKLEKVENLTENVTDIGGFAFGSTAWLNGSTDEFVIVGDSVLICYNGNDESVKIPDGVKKITAAFRNRDFIESVEFPDSVVEVGYGAFDGTSIKKLKLGKNVEKIDSGAFAYCTDMSEVWLPKTLKEIGEGAFLGISDLKKVSYEGSEEDWKKVTASVGNEKITEAEIEYNAN